ncbi:MAG: hypothetical protein CSH37_13850 [Thalassolituus sp.]|nr:MAG: hypothetical protein CSH37_13850 [Thalassolituus sp.]
MSGLLTSASVCALEPMTDRDLSDVSGQAFITIDTSSYNQGTGNWSGDYEFTKVNLGMELETVFNIDELRVSRFDRDAYVDGTVPVTDDNRNIVTNPDGSIQVYDSDIIINNFALGRVDNYDDAANAEYVPFMAKNPYIELAYKIENGEKRVSGLRVGFEKAQGDLSGDIISLTGKVEGEIRGDAAIVYNQNCSGPFSSFDCFTLSLAQGTEIYTQVDLVDGATGDGADGLNVAYLKRASWFGVPNGRNFDSDEGGLIAALVPVLTRADDCEVTGTPGCFRTSIYQSIYIGDKDASFEDGSASGVFISMQTESVPWEDLSGVPGTDRVLTDQGAYMNIARYQSGNETKYPLYLTLEEATNGTQRVATCVGRVKGC